MTIAAMWHWILPTRIDNGYGGHKVAAWLLFPIALMKLPLALYAIFQDDYLARTADAIPLDTFTSGGASTLLALLGLGGSFELLFGVALVVAAFRYRALVPLMYLLLLVEYLSKGWILLAHPIETARMVPPFSATFFLLPTL